MSVVGVEGELLGPATVEASCDVCGESFTGPAGGKGSAPMLLGRHRWNVHRIRKDGSAGSSSTTPAAEAPGLVDAIADAGSVVKGTGAPRADQIGKALGKILASATRSAGSWAVHSDPLIAAAINSAQSETEREIAAGNARSIAALLAVTEDSATRIAAPFGRLLAPTQLNKKFGRAVVDNTDLGPALVELGEVGRAWAQFLGVRRQHVRELRALRLQAAQQAAQQQAGTFAPAYPVDELPVPAAVVEPGPIGSGVIATPTYRTQ